MAYAYLTDSGRVREHNEDSVIVLENIGKELLMVVADGMGGHKAGEIASSIAVSHIADAFKSIKTVGEKESAINWLKDTVSEANHLINKHTYNNPECEGMGTTLVIALLTKEYLLFGNIGDSSGFVIKNNKLHKITNDHTLVNLLISSGDLTEAEAREHPKKNVLMKALGSASTIQMDIFDISNEVDAILLSSDGLTNMLENKKILETILEEDTAEDVVDSLIEQSNLHGGTDNISVAYYTKEVEF